MFKRVSAEDFVESFKSYPSYDNIRKIASVVDGLKNSSRKVVYYCLMNNIPKPVKTAQIKSQIENATQYLHGCIAGVVENLAKDYTGANNINLMEPHGNFGTSMVKSSSAIRYTFTKPATDLYELFDKTDLAILDRQWFEGDEIEPVYLMPKIPMLLVNGSEGISSGYAQKILSRNPAEIKKSVIKKLKGNHVYNQKPWFRGFVGEVEAGENPGQWVIKGIIEKLNTTQVHIKVVPFTYDLAGYLKILDKLEDDGIIRGYEDNSELEFDFVVKFTRENLSSYKTDEDILKALKLTRTITENYTVQNEVNRVVEFDNVNDIMDYFIKIKTEFLQRKIEYKIKLILEELDLVNWKRNFIQKVINGNLIINNRKKKDIENDLHIDQSIGQCDNSYDYLLNMSLMTMTKERITKLDQDIKAKQKEFDYYNEITPENLYLDELKNIN
jgi:DNA topoisomerase-2